MKLNVLTPVAVGVETTDVVPVAPVMPAAACSVRALDCACVNVIELPAQMAVGLAVTTFVGGGTKLNTLVNVDGKAELSRAITVRFVGLATPVAV